MDTTTLINISSQTKARMEGRKLQKKLNNLWIMQSTIITGLMLIPALMMLSKEVEIKQEMVLAVLIPALGFPVYHYAVVWCTAHFITYFNNRHAEIDGTLYYNPKNMFMFGILVLVMDIVGIAAITLIVAMSGRPGPYKYERELLMDRFESQYGMTYYDYYLRYGELPPEFESLLDSRMYD